MAILTKWLGVINIVTKWKTASMKANTKLFRAKIVRIEPLDQLHEKKKFGTPPWAPIKNFVKFRKIELSGGFSHQNQKSFKTPFLYTKIHHLSKEGKYFQIPLTLSLVYASIWSFYFFLQELISVCRVRASPQDPISVTGARVMGWSRGWLDSRML